VVSVLGTGQYLIAGDFTTYAGTNVNHLARLNPDGTLDTTFAAPALTSGRKKPKIWSR